MRLRGLVVLGTLVIGAACGDSVGPPGAGQDLEFVAPAARAEVRAMGLRSWKEPITAADSAKIMRVPGALRSADGAQLPVISQTFVTGEWNENAYTVMYGMFGGGTGYTMTPHIRLINGSGATVFDRDGIGKTEDAPLYWYMRPTAEETWTADFSCDGRGETNVRFEARLAVGGFGPTVMAVQKTDQANTIQRACATAPTGGGAAPPTSGIVITICYYEAWLDSWGNVIAVFEYGCTTVGGAPLAE